VKGVKGFVKVF